MSLSVLEFEHLCHLAKLAPAEASKESTMRQCSEILSYMEMLKEVDTVGIEPLYSPVFHENIMREDIAKVRQNATTILANAPESDGKYFIVPRIVEGK